MTKRMLALILSFLLCIGMMPTGVYAEQLYPADAEEMSAQNSTSAELELHWYDQPDGWDDTEDEADLGFNPYSFSLNEDRTVSAQVALQSAMVTETVQIPRAYAAVSGNVIDPDAPVAELANATYVTDGANVSVTARILIDNVTNVAAIFLYELTDDEAESIYTVPDSNGTQHYVRAMTSVQFDSSTMISGTENGSTVIQLNTALKLFGNVPTAANAQTVIGLTVTKNVDGEYVESALSTKQVTVEEEAPTVPAPTLLNATCVSDGSELSAKVRFLVQDTTDIADIEVYELTDTEPSDSMGTVNGTYFTKSIMTVPFDNSTMNLGPDGSGMTVIELTTGMYSGNNAITAVGNTTLIAVQVVKRSDNQYVSSPVSNAKQVTVEGEGEPGELTAEELQAFIPTNLRITAENGTNTLDVTVTWDNPENASIVQFYEVENGLLNGTRIYPFDGVVQSTIIQGDGTAPYEYQTVNGTNILRYSIMKKISEDMKQIDEELGVALCVDEGDTIQTTLWACVGENCQETEQRSVAYVFETAAPVPAPTLLNATCISDGSELSAKVRFLVQDTTDIADIEVYELIDTEPSDSMGTVNGTYFTKSIMTVPFDNSTMNLGPDGSGMTVIELTTGMYSGNNAITAVGNTTLIAVQVVKRSDNQYVSSPVSNAKQVTVEGEGEPGELTAEELQAFIPTNLRITAENGTNTLDVTVTWDNPENASIVQFYEVENGLLNGTRIYPFDGVVQSTIIQGDGTAPYEYQTVNGTNILRYSIMKKISEDMKQIDEELGVALCVAEGDTIQTTIWACVGDLCQETEQRSVTYLYAASAPVPLNTNSTSVLLTPTNSTYSGEQLRPAASVSYEGKNLTSGIDFDLSYGENVNVGNGTVTVIGKGNYCENMTVTFPIMPLSLKDENVTVSLLNNTCIYTGSPIQAEVSVIYNGTALITGTDYQVAYADNTAIGNNTAKVTVTGQGNFGDSVEKTFSIIKPDLVLPSALSVIESEAFSGGGFTSVVIPSNVTAIAAKAFEGCNHLAHVFIYSDHMSIADDAFPSGIGLVLHCRKDSDAALFAQRKGFALEFIP